MWKKKIKHLLLSTAGSSVYNFVRDTSKKWFPSEAEKHEQARTKQRQAFYETFIKEGSLCFDVGANLGNRIMPLLNLHAKVIAVEPQKKCAAYLRKKFGNRIQLVEKGLGSKEETRDFYMSDADVLSSFSTEWIDSVKEGRFRNYHWQKPVKIEMTTLDNLIKQYGVPQFIKIDVEGFESEVIKGLSQKIQMISYEYTTPEQTLKAVECIELLLKISPLLLCNYCIGENTFFCMTEWIKGDEMISFIKSKNFSETRFGDIYVQM